MNHQRTDDWGRVVLSEQGLVEIFYKGLAQSSELLCENTPQVETYNNWCKTFDSLDKQVEVHHPLDIDPQQYHDERQSDWLMPSEYSLLDIEQYLIGKCTADEEIERVSMELALFKKHNMYDVLRLFVYIVDTLRAKNILWGVGRGSSVASYCLYLIGVHKINSIQYNLDIREFIRD